MPGEFEPHAGTWMAWPRRPDNWRDGAGPGPGRVRRGGPGRRRPRAGDGRRASRRRRRRPGRLGSGVDVVAIPADDAWMRDIGPTFVVDDAGAPARGRLGVQRVGRRTGAGSTRRGTQDDAMAAAVCAAEGVDRYRAPFVLRGRRDPHRRRRHAARHRGVPAPRRTATRRCHAPRSRTRLRAYTGATHGDLARARRRRRRDRRPRRQPRVLRAARRRGAHRHRRPRRSAVRAVARRPPPARGAPSTRAAARSRCTCCTSPVRCS